MRWLCWCSACSHRRRLCCRAVPADRGTGVRCSEPAAKEDGKMSQYSAIGREVEGRVKLTTYAHFLCPQRFILVAGLKAHQITLAGQDAFQLSVGGQVDVAHAAHHAMLTQQLDAYLAAGTGQQQVSHETWRGRSRGHLEAVHLDAMQAANLEQRQRLLPQRRRMRAIEMHLAAGQRQRQILSTLMHTEQLQSIVAVGL